MSSRRLFASTPRSNNLISELYVQQIKQFKPSVVASDADAVKPFQMPTKPAVPSQEINADAVAQYEASNVETTATPAANSEAATEEDWFVFEEQDEHH